MDIQKIRDEVAAEFGIEPGRLEAGSFSRPQWEILFPLLKECILDDTEDNARRYLHQKAKFLTAK